ncbi:MAG: hypothetical protein Q7U53_03285 [Anaerolineaceae bacterium]|nr:hypothetical protein [Anaerolineaceae bacterium]
MLKESQKSDQLKTGSVPKRKDINKKLRRTVLKIVSNILILIGWSFPLLMIIHALPDHLLLMFLGVTLIGIGSVTHLFIMSGEI